MHTNTTSLLTVLVFCDLLGGTPFNQAMMAAQSYSNVEAVTGTNPSYA